MKTSETLTKLPAALLKAQAAITFAAKDATNPHFKNRYADLGSVIDAIKPHLNFNGIVYLQTATPSDDGRLHLVTRLIHESGEWVEDTMVMPLSKQDPQGFGSAMTYARRYSLAAITGLYQDDDDGNEASKPAKIMYLSETQISDIQHIAEYAGVTAEEICKVAKVKSLKDIESSRFDGLAKWVTSQRKELNGIG
jgi:hypothetical protein